MSTSMLNRPNEQRDLIGVELLVTPLRGILATLASPNVSKQPWRAWGDGRGTFCTSAFLYHSWLKNDLRESQNSCSAVFRDVQNRFRICDWLVCWARAELLLSKNLSPGPSAKTQLVSITIHYLTWSVCSRIAGWSAHRMIKILYANAYGKVKTPYTPCTFSTKQC